MPGERVKVTLTGRVAREAARRAESSGLSPGRWTAQVVESFLAGERCRHGPARPAAETPGETEPARDA
jgi:hypothetical protein